MIDIEGNLFRAFGIPMQVFGWFIKTPTVRIFRKVLAYHLLDDCQV